MRCNSRAAMQIIEQQVVETRPWAVKLPQGTLDGLANSAFCSAGVAESDFSYYS